MVEAQSITTNDNFLFFTGKVSKDLDKEPKRLSQLFIQKKNGAGYYSKYNARQTEHLKAPGAVLSYKDTLLLVANQGFISQLDLRGFPPTADDFYSNDLIALSPGEAAAPRGMAFMSDLRDNVEASRAGAVSTMTATLLSISSLALLMFF